MMSSGHDFIYIFRTEVVHSCLSRCASFHLIPAEYCLPLVRVGGLFVAAKGHDPKVNISTTDLDHKEN